MAKKKTELDIRIRKIILAELKRFVTIIDKYLPAGKNKKEILEKFKEVAALVEKAVG